MSRIDRTQGGAPLAAWQLNADTTLVRVLETNARVFPQRAAMREKRLGIWEVTTWSSLLEQTLACAAGLEALGFEAGDALLVVGDNRPRLYAGMIAAGALGGYAMPAFPDATLDEVRHIVQKTSLRFALAEDQEQVDKMLELRDAGTAIDNIAYDDPRGLGYYDAPGLVSWQRLIEMGTQRMQADAGLREALLSRSQPDGPAVLIHSSGTTGKPKGVVLSHRCLLAGVRNAYQGGAYDFGEEILAYLPIAWVGDFTQTVSAGMAMHFTINIPEQQETVLQDLCEIAPTLYLAAPRSWDNMLTTIQVRMEESTWLKKAIYNFFMNSAVEAERCKLNSKQPGLMDRLMRPLGELLVFGPIKDQLGMSRMHSAFTGGEAMGEDTFVFYRALGVKLRQLYGQTESAAICALQDADDVWLHTVGKPLPGVEGRITEGGEIQFRSESVFKGYYGQPEGSATGLTDGWLSTGDAGYFQEDGQLVVLGRLSDVVYTANGERYIPNYIENRLKFSPYVKDVAVFGKGRDTLSAMICIDRETVGHWAEVRGISYISYADLSQKPEVRELVATAIRHVNKTLPEGQRISHFVCLHKEFDPDDGEITRTRKLRRNVVEERYAPIIEGIYSGADKVVMRAQVTYETGAVDAIERVLDVQRC